MMEKVTLPKDVAEAIEDYLSEYDKARLIKAHSTPGRWSAEGREAINKIDVMTLAAALVNGYEVEVTPEDDLLKTYLEFKELISKYNDPVDHGVKRGIDMTLTLLGIKIKGINDNA